jgi:hypothetical protein
VLQYQAFYWSTTYGPIWWLQRLGETPGNTESTGTSTNINVVELFVSHHKHKNFYSRTQACPTSFWICVGPIQAPAKTITISLLYWRPVDTSTGCTSTTHLWEVWSKNLTRVQWRRQLLSKSTDCSNLLTERRRVPAPPWEYWSTSHHYLSVWHSITLPHEDLANWPLNIHWVLIGYNLACWMIFF